MVFYTIRQAGAVRYQEKRLFRWKFSDQAFYFCITCEAGWVLRL